MRTTIQEQPNKSFLILTSYFAPEFTGVAVHSTDLVAELRARGHEVNVFTGMPHYPEWRIFSGYRGRFLYTENLNGVQVYRNWLYVPRNRGGISSIQRIFYELTFVIFQLLYALLHIRVLISADRVIVFSPSFLQGVNAMIFSMLFSKKVVFHVEDIQPDSAVDLGMIKGGVLSKLIISFLRKMERLVYNKSFKISTLTAGMRENIQTKIPKSEQKKVVLLPYWVDFDHFCKSKAAEKRFRAEMFVQKSELLVGYAGNLGRKQKLSHLLQLASSPELDSGIRFVIAGEGAEKQLFVAKINQMGLTNVHVMPLLSGQDYIDFLNGVDISYLSQDESADKIFIPSKLFKTLSSGSPVLCIAGKDSELAKTVAESGAGFVFAFNELAETISLLNKLTLDRKQLEQLSEHAIFFSRAKYGRDRIIADFLANIDG